jgi:hypothetical protein
VHVSKRLTEAELAFLNAPFNDDGWTVAVQQLAALTGSRVAQLCGTGGSGMLTLNLFSDTLHDPHRHLENPSLYGPENWRVGVTTGARTIQHDLHYAAYRAERPPSYYDDAISDLDVPFGCQSALMMDDNGMVGLALLRSSRDGPCSSETVGIFARVAHQAHRAVRVQAALGEEAAVLLLGDVGQRCEATILLDGFANISAMTPAAEALFVEPGGLELHGLHLRLAVQGEDEAFQQALGRLLISDGVTGPVLHQTVVGQSPASPGGRWRLVATRLPARARSLGFDPHIAITLRPKLPGGGGDRLLRAG